MPGPINTLTSKVALILGRFTPERKYVLEQVRDELRKKSCIPVLFDFDPPQDRSDHETVMTLANLAWFIIADLTDAHMVRNELSYITANVPNVPVQQIILGNDHLPPEYRTWELYRSFLPVYWYADLPQLLANLTEAVITPAGRCIRTRHLTDGDSAS